MFTLNAFPVYVSPVPAVVVAPLDTSPLNTASPPLDSDGSERVPIEALVVEDVWNEFKNALSDPLKMT